MRIYVKGVAHYRASRGLGRAFTEAVLEAGDRVVATARNPEQLVELQGRYSGKSYCRARCDQEAQSQGAFEAAIVLRRSGRAREQCRYGYVSAVEDTSLADFRRRLRQPIWRHHHDQGCAALLSVSAGPAPSSR